MIRIVSLTEAGEKLAIKVMTQLSRDDHAIALTHRPEAFTQTIQNAFSAGEWLVLICATGIAVRTLGPVLQDKHQDPPVLVLDDNGDFVIPLLSGHEGGANEWGRQLSEVIGAQLVMTTAKPYLQPMYAVGMGCERGCDQAHLHDLLMDCLKRQGIGLDDIASINSIDIKADEQGLIDLAKATGKAFQTFDVDQLAQVGDQIANPSDYVYQTVGVYGVAESAALFAAHQATNSEPELVLQKRKTAKATCAIARAYPPGTPT